MKNLLGAIAAAMLLGAGCAHERGSTTQTEAPASPQASVGTSGVTSGLTCEVINGNTAGVSSSAPVINEGSSSESIGMQQSGTGGSASGDQSAIGGSSSGQIVRDDAASQLEILEEEAIGGSGSKTDTSGKAPVDDSASESQSFEDTDMGGTGGGGG